MKDILEKFTAEYNREHPFFGNIRVTSRGRIVYQNSVGYADLKRRIPLTEHSRFTLYSLSKPSCAMGLLLLRDRGLVDIDVHPGIYVPEARRMDERVTIRHLLHHTSGLPDFEQNKDFCQKMPLPGWRTFGNICPSCAIIPDILLRVRMPDTAISILSFVR